MEAARKRGRLEASEANGGSKRPREMESLQTAVGSKSKPCTKFFSTAGCPFGAGCHFAHYVPGGYHAVAQMTGLGNPTLGTGRISATLPVANTMPISAVKTRLCTKYNTAEGCKFGDRCRFAHGEREIGKPVATSQDSGMTLPVGGRMVNHHLEHSMVPQSASTAGVPGSFGASSTAKISVDASLAGAIIGKGGSNTKQISRLTGAKLFIRDHESDANLKNIELEGTFDQINHASQMVRELIINISAPGGQAQMKPPSAPFRPGPGVNYKTKLCDNFTKGSCTFGDRCNFAHGEGELRKTA